MNRTFLNEIYDCRYGIVQMTFFHFADERYPISVSAGDRLIQVVIGQGFLLQNRAEPLVRE